MKLLVGTSSKMNLTSTEAAAYLDALVPLVDDIADRELFVLLPFTAIWVARDRLTGTNLRWGAQDVHPADAGAHTGDVSAPMLADLGCTYVEVGHHERRRDHAETDELVAAKAEAVRRSGMAAIVCVGERERLPIDDVVEGFDHQLRLLGSLDRGRLIVAYEPAWAIGAGAEAASPAWVGSVHAAFHARLAAAGAGGDAVPVIYGGSVSVAAAPELLDTPGVNGLFVGRMALDPRVFAAIARTPSALVRDAPGDQG